MNISGAGKQQKKANREQFCNEIPILCLGALGACSFHLELSYGPGAIPARIFFFLLGDLKRHYKDLIYV